jgi:hypothetical protein
MNSFRRAQEFASVSGPKKSISRCPRAHWRRFSSLERDGLFSPMLKTRSCFHRAVMPDSNVLKEVNKCSKILLTTIIYCIQYASKQPRKCYFFRIFCKKKEGENAVSTSSRLSKRIFITVLRSLLKYSTGCKITGMRSQKLRRKSLFCEPRRTLLGAWRG